MRPGGSYALRTPRWEEIACQPGTSAAERLWFNKGMQLTKPAQAMELRS